MIRRSRWDDLDPRTAHDLIALRIGVFVVEQGCPYPELDGRDVEESTEHLWIADDDGPATYLRILRDPDGTRRIGRVCTRIDARGRGLGERLMRAALDVVDDQPGAEGDLAGGVVIQAQAYLEAWYGRFGFTPIGAPYVEDGIDHVPMRRPIGPDRAPGRPPSGPRPSGQAVGPGSAATSSDSSTLGPVKNGTSSRT